MILCLFVLLFVGWFGISGDLSFFTMCADRPDTMVNRPLSGASMSAESDKNGETQCILISMQTMIGTLVQKVSDTENKYEELRGNE